MIRDAAHCVVNNGKPLPRVVPVAIQQGRHVAHVIDQDFAPALRSPFIYADCARWQRSVVHKSSPRFARFMLQDSSRDYSGASSKSSS